MIAYQRVFLGLIQSVLDAVFDKKGMADYECKNTTDNKH